MYTIELDVDQNEALAKMWIPNMEEYPIPVDLFFSKTIPLTDCLIGIKFDESDLTEDEIWFNYTRTHFRVVLDPNLKQSFR